MKNTGVEQVFDKDHAIQISHYRPLQVNTEISTGHAIVIELIITFELVFTVFATCDPKRIDLKGSAALAIGLSVCIGHLFAVSIS